MALERHPDPRGINRDFGAYFTLTPDGPFIDFNGEFVLRSVKGGRGRVVFFVPKPLPLILDVDFITGDSEKHLTTPLSRDWFDIGSRTLRLTKEGKGRAGAYIGLYRVELQEQLDKEFGYLLLHRNSLF